MSTAFPIELAPGVVRGHTPEPSRADDLGMATRWLRRGTRIGA